MLIYTDASYLVGLIVYVVIYIWFIERIKSANKLPTSELASKNTLAAFKRLSTSTKIQGTLHLFGSLSIGVIFYILGTGVKYYYGYVQIPERVVFLQRPYSSWFKVKGDGFYFLELMFVAVELLRFIATNLYMIVLYNAASLAIPSSHSAALETDVNNGVDGGGIPLSRSLGKSRLLSSKSNTLCGVGTLIFMSILLGCKISSFAKFVVFDIVMAIWLMWNFYSLVQLQRILMRIQRDLDFPAFSKVPPFRIKEQISTLGRLMSATFISWFSLVGSGILVGEIKSPFWLDCFSVLQVLSTCGVIFYLIELVFPDECYNFVKKT